MSGSSARTDASKNKETTNFFLNQKIPGEFIIIPHAYPYARVNDFI